MLYDAELSRRTMAMLALGSALYMLGLAIAQAVIALHGHALVALGWTVGMVAFVVSTWLISGELFRRVELGGARRVGHGDGGVRRGRCAQGCAPARCPNESSMMEAITDMPFET